ncbi:hypothetical protein J2S30_001596 [Herbaspirillum rubrisubalbicans]|uniref:hypothetical protein n=1 Tax=Herbaspirillum rubrisubalbicans TaxID=80842 RepID=UPI0015C579EF|nr:hypothetical protein [Herbaspirillum rubrisubalbicans]MCP1573217.1 hypothetical protein [Herbaspirillum rubrisubalbicans]
MERLATELVLQLQRIGGDAMQLGHHHQTLQSGINSNAAHILGCIIHSLALHAFLLRQDTTNNTKRLHLC